MSRESVFLNRVKHAVSDLIWWVSEEVPGVRPLIRLVGPVKRWFAQQIKSDVDIADTSSIDEATVRVDSSTTPAIMEFKIPVVNKSADDLQVSGVDLRFGLHKHGAEVGQIHWSSKTGVPNPRFLTNLPIRRDSTESFCVKTTPPPYIYWKCSPFSIHASGTIQLNTSYGPIRIPISQFIRVDDDLINEDFDLAVEDIQERFSSPGSLE